MGERPVFDEDLGKFFKTLREEDGGWSSQRQAAQFAKNNRLQGVSYQVLQRLESGKTKNPEPTLLRSLAVLYKVPYETLVEKWVEHRFGTRRDLIRHNRDQQSGLPSTTGEANDPAAARLELQELRALVARYEKEAREVRTVTDSLRKVALALEEIRKAPKGKAGRSGGHRKVG